MSIRVMAEVWELPLSATEKLVLLALADCANDQGDCWPSIATLSRKSSVCGRSVQRSIQALKDAGHLSRVEVAGRGCRYRIHPRHKVTPDTKSPPTECPEPPTECRPTPDRVSPKPSKNHQEPSKHKKGAHELPKGWVPFPFGHGTKCEAIQAGWSPSAFAEHLEHFAAHHRARGSKFRDWQSAWTTWVLNSEKFKGATNGRSSSATRETTGQTAYRIAAELSRSKEGG